MNLQCLQKQIVLQFIHIIGLLIRLKRCKISRFHDICVRFINSSIMPWFMRFSSIFFLFLLNQIATNKKRKSLNLQRRNWGAKNEAIGTIKSGHDPVSRARFGIYHSFFHCDEIWEWIRSLFQSQNHAILDSERFSGVTSLIRTIGTLLDVPLVSHFTLDLWSMLLLSIGSLEFLRYLDVKDGNELAKKG